MSDLAFKKLKQLLARVNGLDAVLAHAIMSNHAAAAEENVNNRLLLAGFLLRYLIENNASDMARQLKTYIIKIYMDNLIGNRVKQRAPLVKCSNYWLSQCSRDEFEKHVLPDVKRSLLRNPELVLESKLKVLVLKMFQKEIFFKIVLFLKRCGLLIGQFESGLELV
jgi:hypothetical protein